MSPDNIAYYAIIPAHVRYDNELAPGAKLLYAEITALSNAKGYCWATNDYFAKLYEVGRPTISRWVKSLVSRGHIESKILYKDNTKEVCERRITLTLPTHKNMGTPLFKSEEPPHKNAQDNITVNNKNNKGGSLPLIKNTFPKSKKNKQPEAPAGGNTFQMGCDQLRQEIKEVINTHPGQFSKELLNRFFNYWTEPHKSKTNGRWQGEDYWDTYKRLVEWKEREEKWNKSTKITESESTLVFILGQKHNAAR